MANKFPWLKLQKKSQPELPERPPIWLGNRSNGEYFHEQTRSERKMWEVTLQRADEQARRLGMERREFLASSMAPQYQQMYGYPALTPEIKAKIFGLNAAKVFCIDPMLRRCAADKGAFAEVRRHWDAEFGERRWTAQRPLGPTTRRESFQLARMAIARNQPGA